MARTINSPGVQITEKDLSLRANTPVGTNVVVPGFAAQGPISEPLLITSTSELEQIYGVPTTPAERYFYYTCKEVLNSPGVLTTVRLPYGAESGAGFSNAYSALFYPMTAVGNEWKIGAPIHQNLTPIEYTKLLENNFEWISTSLPTGAASADLSATNATVRAGFVVLNDLQTTVNEIAEGYYVGFADNSAVGTGSENFNSILTLQTLTGSNSFGSVNTNRIDFELSATETDSAAGVTSISESLEKVGFVGFEDQSYDDHVSFGVYKIRRSTVDATQLTLGTTEKYLGSFDFNRKQVSPSGGILSNAFIEDIINETSPTVKVMINPAVSKFHDWTVNSTLPTTKVRVENSAKALFSIGVYTTEGRTLSATKEIGSVVGKLNKALRTLEVVENTTVDVVVDAGLSTIYSMTDTLSSGTFNDEQFVSNVSNLQLGWRAVANELINFAESTRKDCMAILDVPRPLLVSGKDSKVIDLEGNTFTADIYNPLKTLASIESNYTAMYANWVKVQDLFTNRRVWIPFSGYAAAIFARSDAVANPWAAPAGLNRGTFNVLDIALNPNQKQRDRFYEISVNPVVFFSGDGFTVMGQKTLQTKPTAFDRINVRRLFLTLERAVSRTLKYFVFEPNTEFTRTRLKNVITPIFDLAKNTEGLYDYLIVADERNNTPDIIDNNELVVDIYIKPVRTAEFILVNFIATRTGQNFQELL